MIAGMSNEMAQRNRLVDIRNLLRPSESSGSSRQRRMRWADRNVKYFT